MSGLNKNSSVVPSYWIISGAKYQMTDCELSSYESLFISNLYSLHTYQTHYYVRKTIEKKGSDDPTTSYIMTNATRPKLDWNQLVSRPATASRESNTLVIKSVFTFKILLFKFTYLLQNGRDLRVRRKD